MWLRIACPNKRRTGAKCNCTLKIVDRVEFKKNEIIVCHSCKAQCVISFNSKGGCHIKVMKTKTMVKAEEYPLIAEGSYRKEPYA